MLQKTGTYFVWFTPLVHPLYVIDGLMITWCMPHNVPGLYSICQYPAAGIGYFVSTFHFAGPTAGTVGYVLL